MKKTSLLLSALGLLVLSIGCKSQVNNQSKCEEALSVTLKAMEAEMSNNPNAGPILASLESNKGKFVDQCVEGKVDPDCLLKSPGLAAMMACVKK